MRNIRHILISTFSLGTMGFVLWMSYAWMKHGVFYANDTPQVLVLSVVIVGTFISVVCFPIFRYLVASGEKWKYMVLGGALGVISVFLFFAIVTRYPVNTEYMLYRVWLYYLIFVLIGGLYGRSYFREFKA